MDSKLEQHLRRQLISPEDRGAIPGRLVAESRRLWQRVSRLLAMNLVQGPLDADALEIACFAWYLPLKHKKNQTPGRAGQLSLRDRAEQAAEMLMEFTAVADQALLERVELILRQVPLRSPQSNDARVLADAINLEDFGVTGLFAQAVQMSRQNACVAQVAEGFVRRQEYGYWEARLKDSFHFEVVRQIAQARLEAAKRVAGMLVAELREDSVG